MAYSSAGGTAGTFHHGTQMSLPREWHLTGVPIKMHQGIRPIRSCGDQGGQLFNHFFLGGDPGLIGIHPHGRKAIDPVLSCPLFCQN